MKQWAKQIGFTIVAYSGIQNSAYDSTVQSDLRILGQKIEQYRVLNGDSLPSSIPGVVEGAQASHGAYGAHYIPSAGSEYNLLYCRTSLTGGFGLVAASVAGCIATVAGLSSSVHLKKLI